MPALPPPCIEPEIAKKSVETILAFLRKEGPRAEIDALFAAVPRAAEAAEEGSGESGGGAMGGLMGAMGGGLMGLAGRLTSLGLDMGEIPTVGRQVLAYIREKAGDERRPSCRGNPWSCAISLELRICAAFLSGNLAQGLRTNSARGFRILPVPAMASDYARLCKKTFWFDEHDQVRARPPVKLVCNVLRQRLSFFVFLRNHIKDRVVGFAAREKSCSPRGRAQFLSERKPVGERYCSQIGSAEGSIR